MDFTFALSKY